MTNEEMFEQYGAAIERVASLYTPPGPARDDLRQDIAVALIGALPRWRKESNFLTYLYRIAHHCGMGTIGKIKVETFDESRHQSHASGPESSLVLRQRHEQLARAMRQLPLGLRLPLSLRLDGLSYKEIGDILDLSENTIGVRLHRATQALKTLMEKS